MLPILAVTFLVGFIASVIGDKNMNTTTKKTLKQPLRKSGYDFELEMIPQEKEIKTVN